MSTRDDDRDYERRRRGNYGRRSEYENDRSYGERSQGYDRDENERDRYATENRWRGQYGGGSQYGGGQYGGGSEYTGGQWGSGQYSGRYSSRSATDDWTGTEDYDRGRSERNRGTGDLERGYMRSERGYSGGGQQRYGSGQQNYGGGQQRYGSGQQRYGSGQQRYGGGSTDYGSQYNYQGGRSGERYGERGRDYEYDRGDYGPQEERGWWDRAADTVASWFGDEEAERRRRMDEQQRRYPGRGPKGYRRSDDRIKEDVNDRLSEGYLDASEIEVSVTNNEVTLTGSVNTRQDKRR